MSTVDRSRRELQAPLQPALWLRTTPTLASFNGPEQSVEVFDGLNVDRKMIATRIDVILETGFCVFDHQVGVKHGIRAEGFPKTANHGGAKGKVRDKITVHHVEMQPIKARIHCFLDNPLTGQRGWPSGRWVQ